MVKELTRTPDSAKEGVDQEDARPPVTPEGRQGKVVGPVLRPQEEHCYYEGVYVDDQVVVQLVRPEVTAGTEVLSMPRHHFCACVH